MNTGKRIEWVDALKGLGIFAIYLGHNMGSAGRLYPFVFTYHVPLFFFVAGFFSDVKANESYWKYVLKQIKHLMIPYFGFVIISAIVFSLQSSRSFSLMLLQGLEGIRNQVFAASLWFIPCIFVMSILYNLILRAVKRKGFALVCALGLWASTQLVFPLFKVTIPSWFWNVDSAMYYIIYYALGAVLFPFFKQYDFKTSKLTLKVLVVFFFIGCVGVSGIAYFKGPGYLYSKIGNIGLFNGVRPIVIALASIFSNMLLAIALKKVRILIEWGKSTLILCGTEQAIKICIMAATQLVGLSISISSPLVAVLYTLLCLVISRYKIVFFINRYVPVLSGKYCWVKTDLSLQTNDTK